LTAAEAPANLSGSNSITVNPNGDSGQYAAISPGAGNIAQTAVQAAPGPVVPRTNSAVWNGTNFCSGTNTITVNPGGGNSHIIMNPTYVGGLTLIRAG